jgi:D-alanyl-lipoteichoic acid acyltransferase DltB (MBOAT superfamily)
LGRRSASLTFLLVASFAFYAYGSLAHAALLALSVAVNYGLGRVIGGPLQRTLRLGALTAGLAFNLSLIFWFKYVDFAGSNLAALIGADWTFRHVILPLGISFYTFQQVAYLVDCWRNEDCEKNPRDFALFVSFFPQLIAGPIVHHGYTRPQFAALAKGPANLELLPYGLMIFAMGLAKKALIADPSARIVDPVYAAAAAGHALGGADAWLGAIGYALQIYFDFSGYSDMAIGLGLMLGVRLPVNFNSPYKARSIIDFWRRWHMTLSAFLRDYVYIPLGGNRKGEAFRLRNIFLTMLIGGVWHGAAWTFVLWGLIHAALITANHALKLWLPILGRMSDPVSIAAKRAATLFFVAIAWVFFRSTSLEAASEMIAALGRPIGNPAIDPATLAFVAFAAALALFAPSSLEVAGYADNLSTAFPKPYARASRMLRPTALAASATAIMLAAGLSAAWKPAVFIYFNF